jgi:hypothetical protein
MLRLHKQLFDTGKDLESDTHGRVVLKKEAPVIIFEQVDWTCSRLYPMSEQAMRRSLTKAGVRSMG